MYISGKIKNIGLVRMRQNFYIKVLMSVFNCNHARRAFTLPEILIAMILTAIVMAIVIPILTYQTSNYANRMTLKSDYKMLQEATDQVVSLHQGALKNVYSASTSILSDYEQYLKYTRDCPSTAGTLQGTCWQNNNSWYYVKLPVVQVVVRFD